MGDGTHFYVDAGSGEIVAKRTGWWRFYDFMWGLHIMDPGGREDTHNPFVIGFGDRRAGQHPAGHHPVAAGHQTSAKGRISDGGVSRGARSRAKTWTVRHAPSLKPVSR